MTFQADRIRKELKHICRNFKSVRVEDIPALELYMDQVTGLLEKHLRGTTRHPETDKVMTKTMINNYVKNKVMIPPVRKKYSLDHILLLAMIYHFKNVLSIVDIQKALGPVMERYALPALKTDKAAKKKGGQTEEKPPAYRLEDIYRELFDMADGRIALYEQDCLRQIEEAEKSFADAPAQERDMLRRFALISQLSAEISLKKMFLERLLDEADMTRQQ